MGRLDGKVALVTGGTSGIGDAAVRRLVAEGAKVVFTGSNAAKAQGVVDATGATFHPHKVEDAAAWPGLIDMIRSTFGRLDFAFANAGIEGGDSSIEGITLDAWNEIVQINLTGPMLTAQHAITLMKDNPGGSGGAILLNSSMNAILALGQNVAYSTTKGALRILAKSIAVHCAGAGLNIRCNAILPGVVETQLIREAIASAPDPAAARAIFEGLSPLKRMGKVEEIAALVAFLASDDAAFISGAEYSIDGASTSGLGGV